MPGQALCASCPRCSSHCPGEAGPGCPQRSPLLSWGQPGRRAPPGKCTLRPACGIVARACGYPLSTSTGQERCWRWGRWVSFQPTGPALTSFLLCLVLFSFRPFSFFPVFFFYSYSIPFVDLFFFFLLPNPLKFAFNQNIGGFGNVFPGSLDSSWPPCPVSPFADSSSLIPPRLCPHFCIHLFLWIFLFVGWVCVSILTPLPFLFGSVWNEAEGINLGSRKRLCQKWAPDVRKMILSLND